MRRDVGRVEGRRPLEARLRALERGDAPGAEVDEPLRVGLVRRGDARLAGGRGRAGGPSRRLADRRGELGREAVLQGEEVAGLSVDLHRAEDLRRPRVRETRRDPEPLADLLETSRSDPAHAEPPPRLLGEAGAVHAALGDEVPEDLVDPLGGDDGGAARGTQVRGERLGERDAEPVVFRAGREVREGDDRHGRRALLAAPPRGPQALAGGGEGVGGGAHRGRPARALLLEHPRHGVGERLGDGRGHARERLRVVPEDRREDGADRRARKGAAPREELPEDGPEGEDVAPPVELLAPHLLGRHVRRRARDAGRGEARGFVGGERVEGVLVEAGAARREAEVDEPGAAGRDEDVRRLHVAVDDPLPVRLGEPLRDLLDERHELSRRRPRARVLPERRAVDELHRDVGDGLPLDLGLSRLVDRRDSRVREGRRGARLVEERRASGGGVGAEDLQRDVAAEARVAREPDLSRRAGAPELADLVRSHAKTGREVHRKARV